MQRAVAASRRQRDGRQFLRCDRARRRAGRVCRGDPRGTARHEDCLRRARAFGRHLPQLGLHPDQGAAQELRHQSSAASSRRLRLLGQGHHLRHQESRRALAQGGEAAVERRRLPAEEAQGHRHRWRGRAARQGQARRQQGRQAHRRVPGQAHHHRHRRARSLAAGPRARRQAGVDLQGGDDPGKDAEVAAGRRLRRDRHRVRQLLSRHGRRGDGGRSARPRAAGGG